MGLVDALGAELTPDYHERNRVFGVKRVAFGLGALLVFVALVCCFTDVWAQE